MTIRDHKEVLLDYLLTRSSNFLLTRNLMVEDGDHIDDMLQLLHIYDYLGSWSSTTIV
jgi:hypothetical protein